MDLRGRYAPVPGSKRAQVAAFITKNGPVTVDAVVAAFPDRERRAVYADIAVCDQRGWVKRTGPATYGPGAAKAPPGDPRLTLPERVMVLLRARPGGTTVPDFIDILSDKKPLSRQRVEEALRDLEARGAVHRRAVRAHLTQWAVAGEAFTRPLKRRPSDVAQQRRGLEVAKKLLPFIEMRPAGATRAWLEQQLGWNERTTLNRLRRLAAAGLVVCVHEHHGRYQLARCLPITPGPSRALHSQERT